MFFFTIIRVICVRDLTKGLVSRMGVETSVMLHSYYFFVVRLLLVLHATFEDFCNKRYNDIVSQIRTMAKYDSVM